MSSTVSCGLALFALRVGQHDARAYPCVTSRCKHRWWGRLTRSQCGRKDSTEIRVFPPWIVLAATHKGFSSR